MKTETVEQYAIRYVNHQRNDKVVEIGFWLAETDTTDMVRTLRQQSYEPEVIHRTITRTYSDWEVVDGHQRTA